jgi:hypothetical protein
VVVVLARTRNGFRVLVLVVLGWFVRNAVVGLWVVLVLEWVGVVFFCVTVDVTMLCFVSFVPVRQRGWARG